MSSDLPPLSKRVKRALRYALIRVAVFCVGLLPLGAASALGGWFGRLAFAVAGTERRRSLDSLAIAFPELSDAERTARARACFEHLGRCAFELGRLPAIDARMETLVEWPAEARAVLDAALARKRGVLFVSGHVGHWELLARRVALAGYPCQTIAKETTDPRLTGLVERVRASGKLKAIWRGRPGAVKEMLRALKHGEILGMLIDQDTKVQSVFVPFFGRDAKTPRAAADLALRTGAAVVLGFCQRVGPLQYRVSMEEVPLPASTGEAAAVELTAALTLGIERAVRRFPEQWVWMHRRWRSRPEPTLAAGDENELAEPGVTGPA